MNEKIEKKSYTAPQMTILKMDTRCQLLGCSTADDQSACCANSETHTNWCDK